MPASLTVTLPWPPAALSPNARAHWRVRHRAAAQYRRDCALLARAAGLQLPEGEGRLILGLDFVAPDRRRRDDDNLIASFKAGRDGLADALGLDDTRFATLATISAETTHQGAVRVTLSRATEGGA